MKLKYTKTITEEIETDIDLPVYFYYQDVEMGMEEYIKYDGKKSIVLYIDFLDSKIKTLVGFPYNLETAIEYNRTTEENFLKEFKYHIKTVKERVYGIQKI